MPRGPHIQALALALIGSLLMVDVVIAAPTRDRDGTRMRARRAQVSKTIKDKLGPDDKHDWRFIEVDKAGTLKVSLSARPPQSPIEVAITDASGEVLTRGDEDGGELSLSLKTTPGIYYIDVQLKGDKATEYTLDLTLK